MKCVVVDKTTDVHIVKLNCRQSCMQRLQKLASVFNVMFCNRAAGSDRWSAVRTNTER